MATLKVRTTANEGTEIAWQQGYEYSLESEEWTEEECLTEYTIPDAFTPAWLEQALDTNPDVIEYWVEDGTMEATKMAQDAMSVVTPDCPIPVAEWTVLYQNADGTYTVTDNGEQVDGLDRENAIRVIVENLTA